MDINEFKTQLHTLFENCDYSLALKEENTQRVKFVHTCPDGTIYNVEVEPTENEFYIFQDGKQIDLFNLNLVDQDGAVPKDKRQMIVQDWNENHKVKDEKAQPAEEVAPVGENAEIIKKFQDQYGAEEGKKIYYATANKQDRDPETFKK